MSGAVTAGLAITLLGLLFFESLFVPVRSLAADFGRAPESVARVFERRLELAAALDTLPGWEQAILLPFLPVDHHTVDDAARAFRDVVVYARNLEANAAGSDGAESEDLRAKRELELDGLRARRALLLAAHGRLEEAQGDLDELKQAGHADFVAAARALYVGRADPDHLALAGDGWIGRIASARAREVVAPAPGVEVHRALTWARAFASAVALGLLVLLVWLGRNRPDIGAASIAIPSLWTPQTGFAVLVRAGFAAIVILKAFQVARVFGHTDFPAMFEAAVASLPLFWLVRRHLARPHRLEFMDVFGFPAVGSTTALATLGLFALVNIGGRAIATAATSMGAIEPWTYQVDEFLIWSSDAAFAFAALDGLLFGVVAVELGFRGVLFPSLRHVHGPIHAALLTGMLYSAVQFASLPTMLALAWTGFAGAMALERTRSLIPTILCVALSSLFEIGLLGALYR